MIVFSPASLSGQNPLSSIKLHKNTLLFKVMGQNFEFLSGYDAIKHDLLMDTLHIKPILTKFVKANHSQKFFSKAFHGYD